MRSGLRARKGANYRVMFGENVAHIISRQTGKSLCMVEVTRERRPCRDSVELPPGKRACPSCLRVIDARRKQQRRMEEKKAASGMR